MNARPIPRRCATLWALCAPGLFFAADIAAQTPRVGVYAENPRCGALAQGSRLELRERPGAIADACGSYSACAQQGDLVIRRSGAPSQTPLVVRYALRYLDSQGKPFSDSAKLRMTLPAFPMPFVSSVSYQTFTPAPGDVIINSIQGDFSPQGKSAAGAFELTTTGTFVFGAEETLQRLTFSGRWSDQIYPRAPGLQGKRSFFLTLQPDPAYVIEPGAETGVVTLDDPPNLAPIVQNAPPDLALKRGEKMSFMVETMGARSDGSTNIIMLDPNFDPLAYSVVSSKPDVVSVSFFKLSYYYSYYPYQTVICQAASDAPLGSYSDVTLTANDGRGGSASASFRVRVAQSLSAPLTVTEPKSNRLTVSINSFTGMITFRAQAAVGDLTYASLYDARGTKVFYAEKLCVSSAGTTLAIPLQPQPAGAYRVEIFDGKDWSECAITKE